MHKGEVLAEYPVQVVVFPLFSAKAKPGLCRECRQVQRAWVALHRLFWETVWLSGRWALIWLDHITWVQNFSSIPFCGALTFMLIKEFQVKISAFSQFFSKIHWQKVFVESSALLQTALSSGGFLPNHELHLYWWQNGVIVAINCLPWTWKCGKPEGWNNRWLLYGYQNFYLLPEKLGCLADKRPNLAKNWFHAQPLNNNKYGSIVHSIHSKVITVQSFYFQFLQTLKLGYLLPLCQASRSSHSYSLVSPPAAPSCDISWFNCPKICPT